MIKFGYLKGYNSYNVPTFTSDTARDEFFDNITGLVEIDAYYPPYFTNVIKTDINEVPQSSPFNFVILVHNEKYYYYFIDNIRYINEELYEVQITMDTTLTHMFDVKIKDCVITRNSINRWITENNIKRINREYIRENLSEGVFEVSNFNRDSEISWAIILISREWFSQSSVHIPSTRIPSNAKLYVENQGFRDEYDLGYVILTLPLIPGSLQINSTTVNSSHNKTVGDFIDNPFVLNMYIINNDIMDKVFNITEKHYDTTTHIYHFTVPGGTPTLLPDWEDTSGTYDSNILPMTYYIMDKNLKNFDIKDYNIKGVSFENNDSVGVNFNSKFIPQLIDENYYQIEYGNYTGFSSYPLHQSKSLKFTLNREIAFTNCDLLFSIKDSIDTTNKFNVNISAMSSALDLITDQWKQYQAQNKGTLSTGLKLQYKNSLYSTAKNALLNTLGMHQAGSRADLYERMSAENPRALGMRAGALTANQQFISGAVKFATGITDGLMQAYNIKKNYDINKENLEYAPDISKSTTSYYTEFLSDVNAPFLKETTVSDIETVAHKLELYGYKQNKQQIYTTSKTIDTIEKNRYYYNCLELRINDYELLSFVASDVMNNFVERLSNGVRLFDMTHNNNLSDNLIYDNVELEEITNG